VSFKSIEGRDVATQEASGMNIVNMILVNMLPSSNLTPGGR
jgi:hypothetical protein